MYRKVSIVLCLGSAICATDWQQSGLPPRKRPRFRMQQQPTYTQQEQPQAAQTPAAEANYPQTQENINTLHNLRKAIEQNDADATYRYARQLSNINTEEILATYPLPQIRNQKSTPLLYGILHQNLAAIEVLLDAGADVNYVSTTQNIPPLIAAIEAQNSTVLHLVMRYEPEWNISASNQTPAIIALIRSGAHFKLLEQALSTIQRQYSTETIKNMQDADGQNLLHKIIITGNHQYFNIAFKNLKKETLEQLVTGATPRGETPLHLAAKLTPHLTYARLKRISPNPNQQNHEGLTPEQIRQGLNP